MTDAEQSNAIVIPLEIWQDPQGDIVLIYSERECSIYFGCWIRAGEPADFIAQLSFQGAAICRSFTREFLPYQIQPGKHHSFVLRVPNSDLIEEHARYRREHYPKERPRPELRHYVVVGHDIYHEILARDFKVTTIPKKNLSDPRLINLILAG